MACLLLAKHNTGKHGRVLIGPPEKDNNGTWVGTYPVLYDIGFRAISAISTRIWIQQKVKCMESTGMFLWSNNIPVIQFDCELKLKSISIKKEN